VPSSENPMELQIPSRHESVKGSRDIRPRKIEEWVNGLPLANLGETARQVYNLLLEINVLNIPSEERQRVLEQLRPTTSYVVDALKKHYVGHPFPLSLKSRKVARLAREILTEMATGYKIVIVEMVSGNGTRNDNKSLVTALHRAVRYFGNILLKTYQVYDPYPAGLWGELHTLYEYAEQHGLHNIPVADNDYTLIDTGSLSDSYKQILLLTLSCPYRLRQGEVEQVEHALERWASYAELLSPHGQETSQALFVTNLRQDNPPTYRVLHSQNALETCRLLDTQSLTQILREDMVHTPETPNNHLQLTAQDMPPDIMRRLMLAWGVIPKRRFTRTKKFAQVQVGIGLSSAHYHISSESEFNPESGGNTPAAEPTFQNRANFSSAPIAAEVGRMPEFWELGAGGTIDWKPDSDIPVQNAATNATPKQQLWKMINVSAGGYCLLWDNEEATQAQVGELVCLQEIDGRQMNTWGMGVIRWMKTADKDGLELGVQMLAPNAVAVAAKISRDGKNFSAYQRCLLLPEIGAIQQPATLLLPALTSQVGSTVIVNIHNKEHHVRLTKMLENTGTFGQFLFAPMESEPARVKDVATVTPKDFDSIWSSI
jgi:hypothetical protein